MKFLNAFARAIDAANEAIGRAVLWLVGAATLISAGNALARYGFGMSSNAWLEIQWYLFAGIILLAA
ncbi:MAG: C4-dicarboxylate ABC transporter, partial [Gammaproteobacteria bacterium]|nr:C4-dicarboxylate ABC transporter [Gammaproteobacteria bacterium]